MTQPEEVLSFWLDEVGIDGWFKASDDLDDAIRERFGAAWRSAREGSYSLWLTYPSGALAYIVLLDQFPRNMFRGEGKAFATDAVALAAAKMAIGRDWDLKIDPPARRLFYLPLMHSESLPDQDRCVRLLKTRMPDSDAGLLHAQAHREVIRRFGRFPYRNQALKRATTRPEATFLEAGGYGALLREMEGRAQK